MIFFQLGLPLSQGELPVQREFVTMRRRRDGKPVWVCEDPEASAYLTRIELRESGGTYDEAWLQELIHCFPEIVPVDQIDPGFGDLIAVCRELPLVFGASRSGALDNLLMTPEGRLVLVEAKLWRNPESRRKVVAQAIEYASAVFSMSYEEFEKAILNARKPETEQFKSLHAYMESRCPVISEEEFIDSVTLNLKRGRAIIVVVGDGIREDIRPLIDILQGHAGDRFVFGLVELGIFDVPGGQQRIIVPSVLAQTTLLERGVVRIQDQAHGTEILIEPPEEDPKRQPVRSASMGEDEFYEKLRERDARYPVLLKEFLAQLDQFGVYPEHLRSLNIKREAPSGNPFNFASISKDGWVDTNPATWWDRGEIGLAYNNSLATLIGGEVREISGSQSALRTAAGKTPQLGDLLPGHAQGWLEAIGQYIERAEDELGGQAADG
ncbi:MAG: hypothetical protein ABR601_10795 [Parasphingopyxis sp.]|nr:hypothetical protein [Sphingomonadales bacterium]